MIACWPGASDITFRRLDIADHASVDEFGKWAEQELQTVDILVNNAGTLPKSFGRDNKKQQFTLRNCHEDGAGPMLGLAGVCARFV